MKRKLFALLFFIGTSSYLFAQKFEGLAKTPPMGWNTWNKFACEINETVIRSAVDAFVSAGMKDAGYTYIVIDDCWHGQRDSKGFIQEDATRFPSGMKALAEYVHAKGLKIGIYSDAGNKTCGGRPGSRGHEYQDAITYASWDIDYLKYDWCDTENINPKGAYTTMRDALHAAGRPILFSMCEWGTNKPWEWAKDVGHMWRTTGDISHCFDCEDNHGTWSSWGVTKILDMQDGLRKYAGPDHWNDPDMMEVGNGMSVGEDRAHFSMWCMLAAPLVAGNDIAAMSATTKEILTNKEAIAIDQDVLGVQGFKFSSKDSVETWFKPLSNDEWAVCFLNRGKAVQKLSIDWKTLQVKDAEVSGKETAFDKTVYSIRNVWTKKDVGTTASIFKTELPGHDVIVIRLVKNVPKKK